MTCGHAALLEFQLVKGPQSLSRVAFLGDYVPRRCGIASFTHDLCEAVIDKATAFVSAAPPGLHDALGENEPGNHLSA